MNKGLAHILLTRISNIPFIDLYAGVISVLEKKDTVTDELGNQDKIITTKIPVSCDVIDYGKCVEYKDGLVPLVPDSKRKGILYFEDLGTKYAGIKSGRNTYTSVLRVICWLNTTFIEKSSCHEITAPVMNEIIKRFCSNPYFSQDGFTKIFVSVSGFPKNGKEIFAAYTYDEAITQYLLPPYESFAIDFNISFAVADNCISEIKLKPDNVC